MIIPCILLEEYLIILEEGVVELVLRNTWSSQSVLSKENRPFGKRSIPDSGPRSFSPGTPVFPSPRKPTFDLICVDS